MIHLVAQAGFADLIQTLKLVQRHGIAVRHDEPVKDNGQPTLAEGLNFPDFTQNAGPLGNQEVLSIMRIDVGCHHTVHRT